MFEYKPYLKSLANYMAENGYTVSPFPKVILDDTVQNGVFIKTGYFDPNANGIRLFINGRHPKDVLRTFAHELIHWKQQKEGTIEKSGYTSDRIVDDKNLIHLEAEAYLKGNIAFRSWTETMQVSNDLQESIHIKKENEGKFTATKERTGKSTEELTHSKNPLTKKRAIFAQNAKKWSHKGNVNEDYIRDYARNPENLAMFERETMDFLDGGMLHYDWDDVYRQALLLYRVLIHQGCRNKKLLDRLKRYLPEGA